MKTIYSLVHGLLCACLILVGSLLVAMAAIAQTAPTPTALPSGGQVVAGQATIGTPSNNTLTIQQNSARAAIDWNSFNIGAQSRVNFVQPSANSVVLNRVLSSDPSQIFGKLSANGQVFLSNPAGIYFAPGASVDVGGLVATTHGIGNDDFMAGTFLFSRNGATGSVVNDGALTANPGGYIALLAPEVRNGGIVTARLGTAALAAGERFTLQFDASGNALANIEVEAATIKTLVENHHAVLAPDGQIILSSRAAAELRGGVVNNSGVLDASSMVARGGRIVITGDEITLGAGSQINASGATGGGTVLVGGDWQGSGATYQATQVTMAPGASIDASALNNGDGGEVVLWSDVGIAGDELSIGRTATFQDANAGLGKLVMVSGVSLGGADAGNYTVPASGSTTADIARRPIELAGTTGLSKVYDGTSNLPVGSGGHGSLSGVLGNDAVDVGGQALFDSASAGTRAVLQGTLALSGAQAGNYSLQWTNGSGTIQKAPLTVRANDDARFTTETDAAGYAGVSFTGLVHGETPATAGITGALNIQRGNVGVNDEGHYTGVLQASGLDASNYQLSYAPGDYTIVGERQLLVRVADSASMYGAPVNFGVSSVRYLSPSSGKIVDVTGSISQTGNSIVINGVEGGSVMFDLAAAGAATSSAGLVQAGSYQLAANQVQVSGSSLRNVITVTGTASVSQKAVTANASGASKVYDGTTALEGVTLSFDGLLAKDVVTASGSGAFATRNAGSSIGYTISSLELAGVDARNYFISGGTSVSGTDGTITPRPLTVSFDGVNKVYDGNSSATVIARDNRIAGDSLTLLRDAAFADKNVGTGKVVTISGLALTGADAGNYSLSVSSASATADITRLNTAVWVGGNTGNWFDPANWQGGAVPDLSNVSHVVIPAGVTVDFDGGTVVAPAQAGPVHVDGIGSGGSLALNGGELDVGAGGIALDGLSQRGGALNSVGSITVNSFSQSGGSASTQGDLTVRQDFGQQGTGMVKVGGSAHITDTQGGTTLGTLTVGGALVVDSTGGGGITQAAGTQLVVGGNAAFNAGDGKVQLLPDGNNIGGTLTVDGTVPGEPAKDTPPPPPPPPPLTPALPEPSASPPPLVLADASSVGRAAGPSVEVSTVRGATDVEIGLINVTLPKDTATSGVGFSFALPEQVFAGEATNATVEASLFDGRPLPAWLRYEPSTRRFVAAAVPDGAFPMQLLVKVNGRAMVVVISERAEEGR